MGSSTAGNVSITRIFLPTVQDMVATGWPKCIKQIRREPPVLDNSRPIRVTKGNRMHRFSGMVTRPTGTFRRLSGRTTSAVQGMRRGRPIIMNNALKEN